MLKVPKSLDASHRAIALTIAAVGLCALAGCGGGGGGSADPQLAPPVAVPTSAFRPIPTPAGAPVAKSIVLGNDEVNVMSRSAEIGTGVLPLPDLHQTFLQFTDGSVRFWVTGGNSTFVYSTADFTTFTTNLTNGVAASVFGPSSPLGAAFDADYAGAGSVFPASNGTDLLMIYHSENHYGRPYLAQGVTPFYSSIGLARSTDGGLTWSGRTKVISGREPQGAYPPPAVGMGAADPAAIITGGYIYVFFVDAVSPTGPFRGIDQHCVARAPISQDGATGTWSKYYQGSFSQPGLGGLCTSPIPPPAASSGITYGYKGDLSFNSALNAFVIVFLGDDGFLYSTSQDLVTWSTPTLILRTPPRIAALNTVGAAYYYNPTLVTPGNLSDQVSGSTGYLFYAKGIQDAGLSSNTHSWFRRSFRIQ